MAAAASRRWTRFESRPLCSGHVAAGSDSGPPPGPAPTERVLAVIKRLAREGRSIIYVTHRLPEVFRIADRVTVFRNGRSLPAKPTSELDVDAVITLMLGRGLDTMFPARGPLGTPPLLGL